MPSFLFIMSFLFLSAFALAADWLPPNFESCEFYERAEEILHCKANGSSYLIDYGKYFCEEFRKKLPEWKLRPALYSWTINTGLCLQEMIYDNRNKRLSPCSQLEEFAFDAHPICYKQYRVCTLEPRDVLSIFNVVKGLHLLTRRSIAQLDNVLLACLDGWLSPEENASYSQIYLGTNLESNEVRRMAIQLFELAPTDSKEHRRAYFRKVLSEVLFDSSSRFASQASAEFLEQFQSDGSLEGLAVEQSANDCLNVFSEDRTAVGRCDPNIVKKLDSLKRKDVGISFRKRMTKERITEILRKMNKL